MRCSSSAPCASSDIIFRNNTICTLLCNELASCHNAFVDVENCIEMEIICNEDSACDGMSLQIVSHDNNLKTMCMNCGRTTSCNNMIVNIIGIIHSNTNSN